MRSEANAILYDTWKKVLKEWQQATTSEQYHKLHSASAYLENAMSYLDYPHFEKLRDLNERTDMRYPWS